MKEFITIAIIQFLGIIMPGQDFIGITRFTLYNGIKNAHKYAAGIAAGSALYIIFSIFGIMQILFNFNAIHEAFLLVSGLYLLYLGFTIIKSKQNISTDNDLESEKTNAFYGGFTITISNPKVVIFYSSILASFIDKTSSKTFLLFITVYMIFATFAWFYLIALAFNKFRYKILKYIYYIEKIFALCLWYFGGKLILQMFIL